jgi:hypothetical protein
MEEDEEETKSSCRTTKTILHGDPFVKDYIYKLVTATSELEARGNLIFTYALLRCNEEEAFIPAKMFSQSFMTACIRTAGLRGDSKDKEVGYGPCDVCFRYMTEAKSQVGHVPAYDFSYLTQLINTLGRRMNTMMINSLWMHMEKRQYRAIKESIQSAFPESVLPLGTFRKSGAKEQFHCTTDRKTILKSIHHFMTKQVIWAVSGAPVTSSRKPNPKNYKKNMAVMQNIIAPICAQPVIQDLIQLHRSKFEHRGEIKMNDYYGYFSEINIKKHPGIFFRYLTFLFQSLHKPDTKAPFQLVPQYTMKRRCIKIGKEETAEMMQRFARGVEVEGSNLIEKLGIDINQLASRQAPPKRMGKNHEKKRKKEESLEHELRSLENELKSLEETTKPTKRRKMEHSLASVTTRWKKSISKRAEERVEQIRKRQDPVRVTRKEWVAGHMMLIKHLFYPPADIKKTWRGVIMTDGISCSWSRSTQEPVPVVKKLSTKRKTVTTTVIVPLSTLGPVDPQTRPKDLGKHGESVWISRGPLNIVAVDPGHATLVDAIRSHHDGIPAPEPLPANHSKTQKRRHNLQAKLAEKNRTHFSLTNAHWQVTCGRKMAASRSEKLIKTMELQPAIDRLAQCSSRVSTSAKYLIHLHARLATMETMKKYVKAKAPRRWGFECYRKEQLAAHQLSKDLFSGCTGPSILVWGDGGFGPTSHGHASAPNKRLRRLLSKYIPVIVSSEYLSSQRSACCLSRMRDCRKIQPGMKRVTVKQCTSCQTLLSRDVSAACVILDIFEFQRQGRTLSLPFT